VIILRIKQFTTGLQLRDLNCILKLKSTENTVYKFMSLPSAQTSTIYNIESGVANMFWDLYTGNRKCRLDKKCVQPKSTLNRLTVTAIFQRAILHLFS